MLKIKKIKPIFNQVITTRNMYSGNETTASGVLLGKTSSTIKEWQTVLAVGPAVKGIEVGDIVYINPKRYAVVQHKNGRLDKVNNIQQDNMHVSYAIPSRPIYDREDGSCRDVLILFDNDIELVVEGEEFDEQPTIMPVPSTIIKS